MNASTTRTVGILLLVPTLLSGLAITVGADDSATPRTGANNDSLPGWLTQPLSLDEALNMALAQNGNILKSKQDIEATHGVVIQTRAIALPRLGVAGNYQFNNGTEQFAFDPTQPALDFQQESSWRAGIRLEQSIYEGGRMWSAFRSAKLLEKQVLDQHRIVINETLFQVRQAYFNILLAAEQITVNEESVALLQKELEDTQRRYDAGTVPRFNVLRAEVQLANAKPALSRSRNAWRISKNNLANLLGYNVPTNLWDNIPLQLSGRLERRPYEIDLPHALGQALQNRPELGALQTGQDLAREGIVTARSGYKPSVQIFGGYEGRSSNFRDDLGIVVDGWLAGAQLSWNLFDGRLSQGKVREAKARVEKAQVEIDDTVRRIELEVRTAYSSFVEAREVLDSTEKVVEQAEEALRLATARYDAGTGTQLDVLAAETSLTEARTTKNVALRDYAVALAGLERAIGLEYVPATDTTGSQANSDPPAEEE